MSPVGVWVESLGDYITVGSIDGQVCGEDATEEREVEGIVCPLCAHHARELDAERAVS